MRKKSPDREKPDLELFRLLDKAGIAMYGPFPTPAAQNEEVLKAWWRQHVDSVAVTRAKTPAELGEARARYKESSAAFEQQGVTGGAAASAGAAAGSSAPPLPAHVPAAPPAGAPPVAAPAAATAPVRATAVTVADAAPAAAALAPSANAAGKRPALGSANPAGGAKQARTSPEGDAPAVVAAVPALVQREQLEARRDAVLGDAPEGDGGVQGGAASEQPESMHVDGDGDAANEHLIPEAANAAAEDDDDEVADAHLEDEAAVAAPAPAHAPPHAPAPAPPHASASAAAEEPAQTTAASAPADGVSPPKAAQWKILEPLDSLEGYIALSEKIPSHNVPDSQMRKYNPKSSGRGNHTALWLWIEVKLNGAAHTVGLRKPNPVLGKADTSLLAYVSRTIPKEDRPAFESKLAELLTTPAPEIAVAPHPRTAKDIHAHKSLERRCVKGDGYCQEHAILEDLGKLDHAKRSQLNETPVAEGTPTKRDYENVGCLRKAEVKWMKEPEQRVAAEPISDPDRYLPPDSVSLEGRPGPLDVTKYGNHDTLCAASAVTGADWFSLDESALDQQHLAFYSFGKQFTKAASEIFARLECPTETPLFGVAFNGKREADGSPSMEGHYFALAYRNGVPSRWTAQLEPKLKELFTPAPALAPPVAAPSAAVPSATSTAAPTVAGAPSVAVNGATTADTTTATLAQSATAAGKRPATDSANPAGGAKQARTNRADLMGSDFDVSDNKPDPEAEQGSSRSDKRDKHHRSGKSDKRDKHRRSDKPHRSGKHD